MDSLVFLVAQHAIPRFGRESFYAYAGIRFDFAPVERPLKCHVQNREKPICSAVLVGIRVHHLNDMPVLDLVRKEVRKNILQCLRGWSIEPLRRRRDVF
ncbi:hypothetical protein G6F65_022135 [Rhizopus arrhizus]|nr:hypothetical protein G6F65_022135 [Rhizopus arrhizus]